MKVLFDAFWWVEGPFSNRTVQRELIQAWAREYPADELVLLVPSSHVDAAREEAPARARLIGTRVRPHGLAAAIAAPLAARRVGADLVVTHNFAAVVGRSVVFIHDVLFQTDPAWFTRMERAYFAWMPLLARRAEIVFTSSRHEAARISTQNASLRSVVPIGLAIRSELRAAQPRRPVELPVVSSFVLTVGRLNVRKNLATTITGALRTGRISRDAPLIVVGADDGRSAHLPWELRQAFDDGSVITLTSVDDSELSWLYGNARLFVFLSLDEGFGLTPVEALTFGCPCVVSDIPVFRETLGERVHYVLPLDVDAAAAAISSALDAAESGSAHSGGAADVLELSWQDSVHRLRDALAAPG